MPRIAKLTRWTADELERITAAARISHPTDKGGNVARMIRESALDAAALTLWPNLEALMAAMDEGDAHLPQWDDLPTYGGEAPDNTLEVWSWDDGRLLVSAGGTLEIVTRAEWGEPSTVTATVISPVSPGAVAAVGIGAWNWALEFDDAW